MQLNDINVLDVACVNRVSIPMTDQPGERTETGQNHPEITNNARIC
jgi:hypothetical protein